MASTFVSKRNLQQRSREAGELPEGKKKNRGDEASLRRRASKTPTGGKPQTDARPFPIKRRVGEIRKDESLPHRSIPPREGQNFRFPRKEQNWHVNWKTAVK